MGRPEVKLDPALVPRDDADNGGSLLYLSTAGGLTQFGAYLDTLMPGAASSDRHWHSAEDEMVYILSGHATLIDDDGDHILGPGDAACWPHGCPNAHHLANAHHFANAHHLGNDGTVPCRYIIIGARVAEDVCTYSDSGHKQVNAGTTWQVQDAAGQVLRNGDLPEHLLNLPAVWGTPFDPANPGQRVLSQQQGTLPVFVTEAAYTHPITGRHPGPYACQLLSDPGGLNQFGAFVEELPPGSRSGHRHWHETEDEMIFILSGTGILVEDGETLLVPGDVACWPAGTPIGHRIDNRSDQALRYLVIGTRLPDDVIHYADHDLVTTKSGTHRAYAHHDGRPYAIGTAT